MTPDKRNNILAVVLSVIGAVALALFAVFASAFLEDFRETKQDLTNKVDDIQIKVNETRYEVEIIKYRINALGDTKGIDLSRPKRREGETRSIGILQTKDNRD